MSDRILVWDLPLRIFHWVLAASFAGACSLVSQSANGRSSTYERDHGGGNKTVTHVFWTIEAAENCPSCDHRFPH